MGKDEAVENTMMRVRALVEHRERLRKWLRSEERRKYYEETRRLEPHTPLSKHLCSLCAYPSGIPSERRRDYEDRVRRKMEMEVKERLKRFKRKEKAKLEPLHPFYNLDGYRLRLEDATYDEKQGVQGGTIVVDESERLKLLPLEKIPFLKENSPELFEES
ncbi:MAG: hypothetical protein FGF53_04115 [Candidatus Brockarchaeota archaeon]|nr:hypothetical protein [Candidatus Brockarchaeota archaeon]MBO3809604.1 hypothetical protein [Candidatus Brockarchaeota archaeon]